MHISFHRLVLAVLLGAAAAIVPSAHAGGLLSEQDEKQLARWLGGGELQLSNIYTKTAGDTARQFHAAVDGKGRTFSVMQATQDGKTWLVGGYNPQSWSSAEKYNRNPEQQGRTAFLFNLSSGIVHYQTPKINGLDEVGSYQTYNGSAFGPTFGWGHDLYVPYDLTHGGHSFLYSYIDPYRGNFKTSLLDDGPSRLNSITYGAIEVYAMVAVPEAASYLMLMAGGAVLAAVTWRRRAA
ncbi:PEP_CTERM-anchored TLD domain-containing protein [Massilia sp. BJB1822]|uniref:PEP_CTERM-anchored TLD domain-containing protein n=1 Tax=Massilia sp. BJB1822 TaxID=2744470 RepID=UPI0015941CAA|nr:PEP_CTERM-anchored TLD domain-containing protein [Massilia sp. BJB1822]NVE00016.1 PEP-CTERM sorting domain-containing protein [Massilia sp. BJB1822]